MADSKLLFSDFGINGYVQKHTKVRTEVCNLEKLQVHWYK